LAEQIDVPYHINPEEKSARQLLVVQLKEQSI